MALQTQDACGSSDAKLVYTYDDVTPFLVHSYQLRDLAGDPGTMTVTIARKSNGAVIGSGTLTTRGGDNPAVDLTPLNLHMTQTTDRKGNPTLSPPFTVSCTWKSA